MQKTAAAAAAEVVRFIRGHVNEILFTNHGFDHKAQVISHRITQRLPDQLAGVLHGELYFQVLVPVGIDFKLSFPDPLSVIFDNALDFKIVRDVEFFQSGPDCEEFVASFSIEPDLTAQIIHRFDFSPYIFLPGVIIR